MITIVMAVVKGNSNGNGNSGMKITSCGIESVATSM